MIAMRAFIITIGTTNMKSAKINTATSGDPGALWKSPTSKSPKAISYTCSKADHGSTQSGFTFKSLRSRISKKNASANLPTVNVHH